jgi:hypothetical protein
MCKNSSPNSLYLRLSKKDKYVDLGVMNRTYFQNLIFSDLSFSEAQNIPNFELRFYKLVDLNIIYILNFRFDFLKHLNTISKL